MLNQLYRPPVGTQKRLLASNQVALTIRDALVSLECEPDPFSVSCVFSTMVLLTPGAVVFNNNPFMVRPDPGELFTCLAITDGDGVKFKPFGQVDDFADEQVKEGTLAYSLPPGHPETRFRHFATMEEGIREGLFRLMRDARARLFREFLIPQRARQSATELTNHWVEALAARALLKNDAATQALANKIWAETFHVALRLASETLKPIATPQAPVYTTEYGWVIPLNLGR